MYVFMDIEATGQTQSEAFQVAMVITNQDLEIQEMLNFYVEHDDKINPYVLELCHLTDSNLEEIERISYTRKKSIEMIERLFHQYDEEIIFVGKMIKGDIKWLRKIGVCCNRIDFMEDCQYIELNQFFEGNRKLAEDCNEYGLTQGQMVGEVRHLLRQGILTYGTKKLLGGGYHNALVDAYAVYRILKEMVAREEVSLVDAVQEYDWTNRSYLMMNRKAMEDKIAVKIYQNQLLKEIKDEYGISIAHKKLQVLDSIMFENGCLMGVTKKDILLNDYLPQLKRSNMPHFNRYDVRVRRGKHIRKLSIIALNRFDLFIQLSKILSPNHIPKDFRKKSVMIGLLKRPSAYIEANGYTLLTVKQKETQIDYRVVS